MRLGCADQMAFGITRPAYEPLIIELHLGETNSVVDVQGGLGPDLVEGPSLKRSFSSLPFIVSQPTGRTILMGLHWRSPSCSLRVAQSRSSSRSRSSYLPGLHMVYCINSTRLHRLDISSSFVEQLLWTRERVIQSRQNVRIRILAGIQLFSDRLRTICSLTFNSSLFSSLAQSFKAVAMFTVLSPRDG